MGSPNTMACMGRRGPGGNLGAGMLLAAALVALAISPWDAGAQAQAEKRGIARLKIVTGNVLVSGEAGMAAGAQDDRLLDHTRILTTANSEAVIEFDDGCEVRLKENERFDVEKGKACALMAGEPLGVPQAAVAAPLAGYILPIVAPGLLLDNDVQTTTPVSPN